MKGRTREVTYLTVVRWRDSSSVSEVTGDPGRDTLEQAKLELLSTISSGMFSSSDCELSVVCN